MGFFFSCFFCEVCEHCLAGKISAEDVEEVGELLSSAGALVGLLLVVRSPLEIPT